MKKWAVLLMLSLVFVSSISAVSAQYLDFREGSEQVIEWAVDFGEPFLQVLLGGEDYYGLLLFEKFLVFILLLSVVYLSLSRVPAFEDNKGVLWTVAVIVPLLAVRYINFIWLNTILIQYGVLGIAIAGILPFIIYLFFLHNIAESSTVRKIGWIFFIVIYFGLWATSERQIYGEVYFWTIVVALLFLFLDRSIHRWYLKEKLDSGNKAAIYEEIGKLRLRIKDVQNSPLSNSEKKKAIKALSRAIKNYEKML